MNSTNHHPRRPIRLGAERLESRDLLSSVPFGAAEGDTAEFMLGDVLVTVVLMESDGSIDPNTETWSAAQIDSVRANVREGLSWWEETLHIHSDVHSLNFQIDFTYAESPVATGYEPISRPSDDFSLWMDDFLGEVGFATPASFSDDIRAFNHSQREKHGTNWAFTIFVVNAEADPDGRFDPSGSFSRGFAYAGGRFFVMPHNRPASTVAHETAHMFWAYDEYRGSEPYTSRRGYFDAQNTNAADGNPNPDDRVISILDSHSTAFPLHAISPSAMEMIGWRDSDHDGIFDVLDVPHSLEGSGVWDEATRMYHFVGTSTVQTLPNQNSSGLRNDITINRIRKAQYRIDGGPWLDAASFDDDSVDLELTFGPLPADAQFIEVRTLDDRWDVASEVYRDTLFVVPSWQNPDLIWDVTADGIVSPIDALLIINRLNEGQAGALGEPNDLGVPPFLDVSGDGSLSPIDALLVINHLNQAASNASSSGSILAVGEAEPRDVADGLIGIQLPAGSDAPHPTRHQGTNAPVKPRLRSTWHDAITASSPARPFISEEYWRDFRVPSESDAEVLSETVLCHLAANWSRNVGQLTDDFSAS